MTIATEAIFRSYLQVVDDDLFNLGATMEKGDEVLTRIASEILAAARAKGATIEDWYLGEADYEKYQAIAQQRGEPDMRICGANIHRATSRK